MTNLINKIKSNPKTSVLGLGLGALIATVSLNDNLHLGSVDLKDVSENQYIVGIWSGNDFSGKINADINSYGLLYSSNNFAKGTKINGNINSVGGIIGKNFYAENIKLNGNSKAKSLLFSSNNFWENAVVNGNLLSNSLYMGMNKRLSDLTLTGSAKSSGMISVGFDGEAETFSNDTGILKNYKF